MRNKTLLKVLIEDIMKDAWDNLPVGERSQVTYVEAVEKLMEDHQLDLNMHRTEIVTRHVRADIDKRAKVVFKFDEQGQLDLGTLFPRETAEALVLRLGSGNYVRMIDATGSMFYYHELEQEKAALAATSAHTSSIFFREATRVGRALAADPTMTFEQAMLQEGEWS